MHTRGKKIHHGKVIGLMGTDKVRIKVDSNLQRRQSPLSSGDQVHTSSRRWMSLVEISPVLPAWHSHHQ